MTIFGEYGYQTDMPGSQDARVDARMGWEMQNEGYDVLSEGDDD